MPRAFLLLVSNRIRKHIERDGTNALRISKDKAIVKSCMTRGRTRRLEIKAMESLRENGFGNTRGTSKRGGELD